MKQTCAVLFLVAGTTLAGTATAQDALVVTPSADSIPAGSLNGRDALIRTTSSRSSSVAAVAPVSHALNSATSRDPLLMRLLRPIAVDGSAEPGTSGGSFLAKSNCSCGAMELS